MRPPVGERRAHPSGDVWTVEHVGEQRLFAICEVTGAESSWSIEDQWNQWREVKPFFQLGRKYKRNGSPSTYAVQSLYANGEQVFAVLYWHNPVNNKDGVTGEWQQGFALYEEMT